MNRTADAVKTFAGLSKVYDFHLAVGQFVDYRIALKMKWSEHKKVKFPITFTNNYPIHETKLINPSNYLEFVV